MYREWDKTVALLRLVRDGKASIVSVLDCGQVKRRFTRLHPGVSLRAELERMKVERAKRKAAEA